MAYKVSLTQKAKKQLSSLERKSMLLIASFIDANLENSENPTALPSAKKLQGVKNGWRWRVGSYRILGRVEDSTITIEIFRISDRKDAYKNL